MGLIKSFIETHHYSKTIFGCTISICFAVLSEFKIVGAAIFGVPAGTGVYEKYSRGKKLLELRKFCLDDRCEKNSASRTLGVMLRDLRSNGIGVILSYADPAHGHTGVIYKAAGFQYLGTTSKRKHVEWKGKRYPDRNIHQTNFPYHLDLRAALAKGEATRVNVLGKHIYVKHLISDSDYLPDWLR